MGRCACHPKPFTYYELHFHCKENDRIIVVLHYTSAHEILRSIANLLSEHVEEVFQGIARMTQILSVVLNHMLLSNMFEDSRDVLLPCRGWQTSNREASKSQCEPLARGRVTRFIAKAGKEDVVV